MSERKVMQSPFLSARMRAKGSHMCHVACIPTSSNLFIRGYYGMVIYSKEQNGGRSRKHFCTLFKLI